MNWEVVAITLLFVCLFIIGAEFVWLYVLAEKQEAHIKKYDKASKKINEMYQAILTSPTQNSQKAEIKALKQYAGNDMIKLDIICQKLLDLIFSEDISEEQKYAVNMIYNEINPVAIYSKLLKTGNVYQKAYSCRRIADFFGEEEIEKIRQYAFSKNRDLSYNACMALSVLGDEDTVVQYILNIQKNYNFSHRIILEILENYSGDIISLARRILEKCDNYIKATVIKGIANYRIEEFEPIYLNGLTNKDTNIKIACVKALSEIGKPEYERSLIIALHDKDWVVRSAAIKGLEKINSENSIKAVFEATKDPEWWVRYNAARSLVIMDKDLSYVESVLNGYDKYAADAVKYSLYKSYSIKEEGNQ